MEEKISPSIPEDAASLIRQNVSSAPLLATGNNVLDAVRLRHMGSGAFPRPYAEL
jgi:hypothetical protein